MDLISILTTVILVTTIATVLTGFVAYGAFKLRDKRKPKAKKVDTSQANGAPVDAIFLTLYKPAKPQSEQSAS
jgi:heme/copper-type cytochrome/quinol oxidase subunit 2